MTRDEYVQRLMVLGQYCYPERAVQTALVVFSCMKRSLTPEEIQEISRLLPSPAMELWEEAVPPSSPGGDTLDCVALAMAAGDYPYRAAAEKAFETVFASLRELVDEEGKERIMSALPDALGIIFEQSKSCALDGSAKNFL